MSQLHNCSPKHKSEEVVFIASERSKQADLVVSRARIFYYVYLDLYGAAYRNNSKYA